MAEVIAELLAEIGPLWHEHHQAGLASRQRKRAVGAGAKHRVVFVDRLLPALVHLRHGTTHDVPACWFGMDRSTITRAVGEVRPLLAERGCTVSPEVRLRSLAEVVDHLGVTGKAGIIDGPRSESAARPPDARTGTSSSPGKNEQNAVKSMVVTDDEGRVLLCSPTKARKLRGHHPRSPVRAGQAPGRRTRGRDPRRCWLPGSECSDRWTRGDTTAPQVQVERPGLVRGDLRAPAQSALLPPPRRGHLVPAATPQPGQHRIHRPRPPDTRPLAGPPRDPVPQRPRRRMSRGNRPHLDDITTSRSVVVAVGLPLPDPGGCRAFIGSGVDQPRSGATSHRRRRLPGLPVRPPHTTRPDALQPATGNREHRQALNILRDRRLEDNGLHHAMLGIT
ncbi:transposase family protein [Streptomyces sp. Lzd4kr]|nr:transposase family protein [Streptomyces sp. Lzd4kr]